MIRNQTEKNLILVGDLLWPATANCVVEIFKPQSGKSSGSQLSNDQIKWVIIVFETDHLVYQIQPNVTLRVTVL